MSEIPIHYLLVGSVLQVRNPGNLGTTAYVYTYYKCNYVDYNWRRRYVLYGNGNSWSALYD